MKIDGFTYVRNGIKMGYPFIQSICSLLPIVDQLFIVVGNSDDGTKEAIENLNNQKIKVIDSVWEENKRKSGSIFRDQANIGLKQSSGDWKIHLQADEVLSETSKDGIIKYIEMANKSSEVDGLIFPFLHFWGDYKHIRQTRRTHAFEVRAFKSNRNIFSFKDSQGFRKYSNSNSDDNGTKLKVLKTDIPIFHYSYCRNPILMKKKSNYFHRFWHDDNWLKENTNDEAFDFNDVDKLQLYTGPHPKYMDAVIREQSWVFNYDPSKSQMMIRDKILYTIERVTGYRFFSYKNYKIIK